VVWRMMIVRGNEGDRNKGRARTCHRTWG